MTSPTHPTVTADVDITGQAADITGQAADITGQAADITGQAADITGQAADISEETGQAADISEETGQEARAHARPAACLRRRKGGRHGQRTSEGERWRGVAGE